MFRAVSPAIIKSPTAKWLASSGSLPAWLSASGGANRTVVGADGLIAAATAPRFDHLYGAKELLVEPQSVNSVIQSNLASATGWTATRSAITTGSATGPDGTASSAGKVTSDATAANSHLIQQSRSYTSGLTYCWSAIAKAVNNGAVEGISLRLPSGQFGGTTPRADFSLTGAGAVGTTTNCTAGIISLGSGWYWCWLTSAATSTASGNAVCYTMKNGTITYDGDSANAVYLWGIMLDPNNFPASRVLTTTASVTASADAISAGLTYQDNAAIVTVRSLAGVISHTRLSALSGISAITGRIIAIEVY
jgi:hypothetical protein